MRVCVDLDLDLDPPTPTPSATASASASATSEGDLCAIRFTNYCPEEGPLTCKTSDGSTVDIRRCSEMKNGQCVGTECIVGGAECRPQIPKDGAACATPGNECLSTSRMGVASCKCDAHHVWKCGHAGI